MVKKLVFAFIIGLFVLFGLYVLKNEFSTRETSESGAPSVEETFSYQVENLSASCPSDSAMICAVDKAVKCTLNPDFDNCRTSRLPKFIFMEDESLDRPTEMTFRVLKLKPLSTDLVEIHTQSTCNGNWFGLCQGYVIYVLVPQEEGWRVKDIYAMSE